MANRAYFLLVDDAGATSARFPEREILAEGINEIPIFWASLFVPGDRRVDAYQASRGVLEVANWCADAKAALRRLKSRHPKIRSLLDERSAIVWDQWVAIVSAETAAYFKTSAAEVWALDPAAYEAGWETLLKFFARPSTSALKAALAVNGLAYRNGAVAWDDPEETACKLAGGEHIRDLPWLHTEFAPDPPPVAEGAVHLVFGAICQMLHDAQAERMTLTPAALLQRMVRILEADGVAREDLPRNVRDRNLHGSADILRIVDRLQQMGLDVRFTTTDPEAFTSDPSWNILFGEQ